MSNEGKDMTANNQGEPPKDTAGVTGGEYADSDPNPAFHGDGENADAKDPAEDLPTHTAFEEGGAQTAP